MISMIVGTMELGFCKSEQVGNRYCRIWNYIVLSGFNSLQMAFVILAANLGTRISTKIVYFAPRAEMDILVIGTYTEQKMDFVRQNMIEKRKFD